MSLNFNANQFEDRYIGKRLQNWEFPKYYPARPRQRRGSTKVISDDNGHLLPTVPRAKSSSFSNFRSTYQLPEKLTRRFAKEYNDCLEQRQKYASFERENNSCIEKDKNCCWNEVAKPDCPTTCETIGRILSADKAKNIIVHPCERKTPDLEYIPGDLTAKKEQHDSRRQLIEEKFNRDNQSKTDLKLNTVLDLGIDSTDPINKLANYDTSPKTKFSPPLPLTASLTTPFISPPLDSFPYLNSQNSHELDLKAPTMAHQSSITGKPHERCPSPVFPAFANFELAKRMHQENLDHKPLPDCVADLAYQKLQISGGQAGLALDIDPIATGVGIKTHNAGPTHCTKMKVFRPKTCGVVPKALKDDFSYGSLFSEKQGKQMGAMDLAICWDYKPDNLADEPQIPKHIDGSNGSKGPAVFTFVNTPREVEPNTGRSAGVFQNTLETETDFFDKDIMRRKTDFCGRNIKKDELYGGCMDVPLTRARSVTRANGVAGINKFGKQYKSSPNIISDQDYKSLRQKYLGSAANGKNSTSMTNCRRSNPGFFQRARSRLQHKVAPEHPNTCCHVPMPCPPCKAPFRVGVPKYDSSGFFVSSDSGCSSDGHHNASRVLVVPRPRNPYVKKNYDISTLVPPFTAINGGAAQGGYPEHWRLSSVYQHAFKPLEQRRRPLLDTVYK